MPTSARKTAKYLPPRLTVAEFRVERGFFGSEVDNVSFDLMSTQSYSAASSSDGWDSDAFSGE